MEFKYVAKTNVVIFVSKEPVEGEQLKGKVIYCTNKQIKNADVVTLPIEKVNIINECIGTAESTFVDYIYLTDKFNELTNVHLLGIEKICKKNYNLIGYKIIKNGNEISIVPYKSEYLCDNIQVNPGCVIIITRNPKDYYDTENHICIPMV